MSDIPRTYFSYNGSDDRHKNNSYNNKNSNNNNDNDSNINVCNIYNNDYDDYDDNDDDYDDEDAARESDGYIYYNGTTMALTMACDLVIEISVEMF